MVKAPKGSTVSSFAKCPCRAPQENSSQVNASISCDCEQYVVNMSTTWCFGLQQLTDLYLHALRLGLVLNILPLYACFRFSSGSVIRNDIHTFCLFSTPTGSSSCLQ